MPPGADRLCPQLGLLLVTEVLASYLGTPDIRTPSGIFTDKAVAFSLSRHGIYLSDHFHLMKPSAPIESK